jgi:hypothetical protein
LKRGGMYRAGLVELHCAHIFYFTTGIGHMPVRMVLKPPDLSPT